MEEKNNALDFSRLDEIFRIILDYSADAPLENVLQKEEPKWDSLAQTSIIAAIESEYAIKLDTNDFETLTSYQDARNLIEAKS